MTDSPFFQKLAEMAISAGVEDLGGFLVFLVVMMLGSALICAVLTRGSPIGAWIGGAAGFMMVNLAAPLIPGYGWFYAVEILLVVIFAFTYFATHTYRHHEIQGVGSSHEQGLGWQFRPSSPVQQALESQERIAGHLADIARSRQLESGQNARTHLNSGDKN